MISSLCERKDGTFAKIPLGNKVAETTSPHLVKRERRSITTQYDGTATGSAGTAQNVSVPSVVGGQAKVPLVRDVLLSGWQVAGELPPKSLVNLLLCHAVFD
jgi:hypothetical protein